MATPSERDRCRGCGSAAQRNGVFISFWVFFGLAIVVLFSTYVMKRRGLWRYHWGILPLLVVLTALGLGIAVVAQEFCIKGCDDNADLLCVNQAQIAAASETQSTAGSSTSGTGVAIGLAIVAFCIGVFWFAARESTKRPSQRIR